MKQEIQARLGGSRLTLLVLSLGFLAFFVINPGESSASPVQRAYYIRYQPGSEKAVIAEIEAMGGRVDYNLPRQRALAVTIPVTQLNRLNANSLIAFSELVPTYELAGEVYPYGLDSVQALDVWDFNRDELLDRDAPTGKGITVCVIDTGLMNAHKDFSATTSSGVSMIDGEAWNEDGHGHGSHVAGSIAANLQGIGLAGVAPGADLFIVKIFDNEGKWIDGQSNLAVAVQTCADHGADIINMSLKGDFSAVEQQALDDVNEKEGLLAIAAAGNDGDSSNTPDDLVYPASFGSVISVGAVSSALTHASFSNENDQVELAAPGPAVISTRPGPDDASVPSGSVADQDREYVGQYMDFSAPGTATGDLVDGGFCGPEDSTPAWQDKVVLCSRGGDIFFRQKADNAEAQGAVATVVFNNEPGIFAGTLVSGSSLGPVVSLTQEDGHYLRANMLDTAVTVTSSDGLGLLPGRGGYGALTGTSMSSAYVSGVAALVWSACPALTNQDLHTLLRETAVDLGTAGRDNSFGYGLVQAFDAWHHCQEADLGGLPRSYGQARHTGSGRMRLGSTWDADSWQLAYVPWADQDDAPDPGLIFSPLLPDQEATVTVLTGGSRGTAWLRGWFDFNHNDHFDVAEMVINTQIRAGSRLPISFSVPASALGGVPVNYRFRLYDSVQALDTLQALLNMESSGTVSGGEVEDGFVMIGGPTAVTLHSTAVSQPTGVVSGLIILFVSALLATLLFLARRRPLGQTSTLSRQKV